MHVGMAQVVGNLQVVGTALPDQGGLDQLTLVSLPYFTCSCRMVVCPPACMRVSRSRMTPMQGTGMHACASLQ